MIARLALALFLAVLALTDVAPGCGSSERPEPPEEPEEPEDPHGPMPPPVG